MNLKSSVDSSQPSMTLTGGLVAIVPIVLLIAKYLELPLSEAEIVTIVTQVGTVVASGTILYGLARKVMVKFM